MKFRVAVAFAFLVATPATAQEQQQQKRNIVVFVADGLRYGSVTPESTPNLWRLKTEGVDFRNSHSLFPTVTTANGSAIATGHYLGDTGDFGNTLYVGQPFGPPFGGPLVPIEDDIVQGLMNGRYGGDYLGETSLLVAVSSGHRRESFEGGHWLVNEIKKKVPVWKKEVWEDGESWIEGPESLGAQQAGSEAAAPR